MRRVLIIPIALVATMVGFSAGCGKAPAPARNSRVVETGGVRLGMTVAEVIRAKGRHFRTSHHSMVGHFTMVYADIAARVRLGKVYAIEPAAGWFGLVREIPFDDQIKKGSVAEQYGTP